MSGDATLYIKRFMKLTLLPRRCTYRKADRVPTKGRKVAGHSVEMQHTQSKAHSVEMQEAFNQVEATGVIYEQTFAILSIPETQ